MFDSIPGATTEEGNDQSSSTDLNATGVDHFRGGFVSDILHRISAQASVELAANLHATASLERLWLFARFAIAVTVMGAAYSEWGSDGFGVYIYAASIGTVVGNFILLAMLRQGKSTQVFITGFVMDNIAISTAWTGSVWLLRGSLVSNDIYLALFPILTLWAARLGFVLGIPYIVLWLIWIGWTLNHYFHPLSYEVENLPLRIVFVGIASFVGMWITYILRRERAVSESREAKANALQELSKAKNEFISGVSHELRTPLTVILGFSQVLQKSAADALTERQVSQLKAIERNGNHLNRLVGDLLDLTRLEANKMALTRDNFNIDSLLDEVAEAFELILDDKQQALHIDSQTYGTVLNADRGRISQVLLNLISNASKYSPKGTHITLRTRVHDDRVEVTVEDKGNGISEADLSNLFTMFFRTENAITSTTPGTGIGLYLCRRIVQYHGGHINVKSELGKGTAVTFSLPGIVGQAERWRLAA